MKKIFLIISLAILTLVLGGCPDILSGKPDAKRPAPGTGNDIPPGFGALQVKVTPGNTRTALPAQLLLEKLSLKYFFDGEEYTDPVVENDKFKFILEPGTYELTIEAYDKESKEKVAEGYGIDDETTIIIEIKDGKVNETKVTLRPIFEEGEGTLSFTINTNVTAQLTAFTLTNLFNETMVHYPKDLLTGIPDPAPSFLNAPYTVAIPAGYYLLQITLEKDAIAGGLPPYARKSEVVHIYKNLTTVTNYEFIDSDFITDLLVTNAADDEPGSLRAVLDKAEDGKIIRIKLNDPTKQIELKDSLVIDKDITIKAEGNDVTITRYDDNDYTKDFLSSFFIIGTDDKKGKLTLDGDDSAQIIIDGRKDDIVAFSVLININNGELVMNNGVTLQNNYQDGNGGGVLVNGSGSTFTMNGGIISGNGSYAGGGGVFVGSYSTFNMTDGTISGNNSGYGGGVYVDRYGKFNMTGGTISKNSSTQQGGGVLVSIYGEFTMNGGTIGGDEEKDANTAPNGGGVFVEGGGTFIMEKSMDSDNGIICGNQAEYNGGGVFVDGSEYAGVAGGNFTMKDSALVFGNKATDGGGVYVKGGRFGGSIGNFYMYNSATVSGNEATNGGAVYVGEDGQFTMSGGTIGGTGTQDTNTATNGGGVYVKGSSTYGGKFTMSTGTISGNTAVTNGGGVYAGNDSTFTMSGGTIGGDKPNTADNGGGVYVTGSGKFTMEGIVEVSGNEAIYGGGVYVGNGGTFEMNGGIIGGDNLEKGNTSINSGGGVYVSNGEFTMSGGTIGYNTATDDHNNGGGGGVYVSGDSGKFTMRNNAEISGNNTGSSGGGVYVNTGIFTMEGGTISKNEADQLGGGVLVQSGTFQMSGGTVYGNDDDTYKNTADNGGDALCVQVTPSAGIAQYGNGTTWTNFSLVDVTTNYKGINTTITVVGGERRTFDVANEGQWTAACSQIENGGGNNKNYVINITESFAIKGSDEFEFFDPSGDEDPIIFYTFGSVYEINVTIKGNGKTISLEGTSTGNLLKIMEEQSVTIENLNLYGGSDIGKENTGSLVYVEGGAFIMSGGTISYNKLRENSSGGGVQIWGGDFTMTNNAIVSHNESGRDGGGVYMQYGSFIMDSGTISGNTATSSGGGVYMERAAFTMNGGTIGGSGDDKNTAGTLSNGDAKGGGVYVYSGTFTMNDGAKIIGNVANNTYAYSTVGGGGGVYVAGTSSSFIMNDGAQIFGNYAYTQATGGGGGVYVGSFSSFTMTGDNARIFNNHAIWNKPSSPTNPIYGANGGGVFVNSGSFTMNSGNIFNNEADGALAPGRGGGVFVTNYSSSSPGVFNMNGGKIYGNEAKGTSNMGGGVCVCIYDPGASFRITGGTVYGNEPTLANDNKNTAITGAALYCNTGSTAEYGTGGSWTPFVLNEETEYKYTDTTIKIVNGIPQT
jgi:hypothetical protein